MVLADCSNHLDSIRHHSTLDFGNSLRPDSSNLDYPRNKVFAVDSLALVFVVGTLAGVFDFGSLALVSAVGNPVGVSAVGNLVEVFVVGNPAVVSDADSLALVSAEGTPAEVSVLAVCTLDLVVFVYPFGFGEPAVYSYVNYLIPIICL